jgi:hypothetical protein
MKPALQAILFAPDHMDRLAIMRGKKQITIREGHRDYHLGQVMLCCHWEIWAVMATITNVRHTTCAEVTEEEYLADGYSSREQMLDDLRRIYPNLKMDSEVTVISWDNLEGTLAKEEYIAEYAELHGI